MIILYGHRISTKCVLQGVPMYAQSVRCFIVHNTSAHPISLIRCIPCSGGYDGTAFLDIVEIYDPATNTWKSGTPLSSVRSGHASAVCYQHVPPPEPDAPALVAKFPRRAPSAPHNAGAAPPAPPASSGAEDVPMANNILSSLSTSHRRL